MPSNARTFLELWLIIPGSCRLFLEQVEYYLLYTEATRDTRAQLERVYL